MQSVSGNDITKIKMEEKQPWAKHNWKCSWEPEPAPNQHIGVIKLSHKLTFFGFTVPFSTNKLEARQVIYCFRCYTQIRLFQLGPGLVYMVFDFGALGKGTTIHHITPEEPMLQRARFVMYATQKTPMLFAKIFLLSEAGHVRVLQFLRCF